MLNKYYVQILCVNQSGGNSQEIKPYDTFEKAEEKYCDALSQYCGNPQTGYCIISIINPYGGVLKGYQFTINHLPPAPEPEPNKDEDKD